MNRRIGVNANRIAGLVICLVVMLVFSSASAEAQGPSDEVILPVPILPSSYDELEETSEYMIGYFAVQIIWVESEEYPWTESDMDITRVRIEEGLNWWRDLDSRADLDFVYIETLVRLPFNALDVPYTEWFQAVTNEMGFTEHWYVELMKLNMRRRDTFGSDWSTTVVALSQYGRTLEGWHAAAFRGGPAMFMTRFGISSHIVAHEFGHINWALDQYYSSRMPCYARSGVLGIENQNSEYGDCVIDVPSIMKHSWSGYARKTVDWYARGQIGWHDYDCDGLFAPVDPEFNYVCRQLYFPMLVARMRSL
jgi:hypothetical protein